MKKLKNANLRKKLQVGIFFNFQNLFNEIGKIELNCLKFCAMIGAEITQKKLHGSEREVTNGRRKDAGSKGSA